MKKIVFLSLIILLTLHFKTNAQELTQSEREDIKLQTVFLYNFPLYISWPLEYRKGEFIVGLLSDPNDIERTNAYYQEFLLMAKNKKAGIQPFRIKKFDGIQDISKCHILYIQKGVSDQLEEAAQRLHSRSYKTLIITDKEGLANTESAINFVKKDGRQKFELNEKNAIKYGLLIASKFKQLAIVIP